MLLGRKVLDYLLVWKVYGRNYCLLLGWDGRIIKVEKRDYLLGKRGGGVVVVRIKCMYWEYYLYYKRGIGWKRKNMFGMLGIGGFLWIDR